MAKKIIAIYAGSFDPPTWGHVSIAERALNFCDELIIAIGISTTKKSFFSAEERKIFWQEILKDKKKHVRVITYNGLTAQLAEREGAQLLIRGLRSSNDLAREMEIAAANHTLNSKLETIFLGSLPPYAFHSSTIVREIAHFNPGADLTDYVPPIVRKHLKRKLKA